MSQPSQVTLRRIFIDVVIVNVPRCWVYTFPKDQDSDDCGGILFKIQIKTILEKKTAQNRKCTRIYD
jgi:hypothetical protein